MGEPRGVEAWTEHTDSFDRVQSIARGLSEPKPISYIAEEAQVTESVAQEYLDQLVKLDVLVKTEQNGSERYAPDPLYARFRSLRRLIDEHTHEELLELKSDLQGQLEDFKEEYEVESTSDLRDRSDDAETADERFRLVEEASEWEMTEYRLSLVEEAISLTS